MTREGESHFEVESIKHGDQLLTKEKLALQTLLRKYRSCFATQISELGKFINTEWEIIIIADEPVTFRPNRLGESEQKNIREMAEDCKLKI